MLILSCREEEQAKALLKINVKGGNKE